MPQFKPFKALRPTRDKAHLVASRSYITYSKSELNEKLRGNPYTFLHVINPEASEGLKATRNSLERFARVKNKFYQWIERNYFHQDNQAGFYIYRQTQQELTFTGIIGCTSVDDYAAGRIKIHEQTITERESVFTAYLDQTNFHAEPVLLTYEDIPALSLLVAKLTADYADFDFSTTDMTRHQLWPVFEKNDITAISSYFESLQAFYIADGHHRSASSLGLAEKRRRNDPHFSGKEAYNFFMSCLIPESQLHIEPFHRLVRDLNGLTAPELLQLLEKNFAVKQVSAAHLAKPAAKHEFGLYLDGTWYVLKLRNKLPASSPVDDLDPEILTREVLTPLLGISDLKTDSRIMCIGGKDGGHPIEKLVNSGSFKAGFWLYPVAVAEMMEIADRQLIMPPKSTWVEPKLRSGLTVFRFEDDMNMEE